MTIGAYRRSSLGFEMTIQDKKDRDTLQPHLSAVASEIVYHIPDCFYRFPALWAENLPLMIHLRHAVLIR